MKPEELIWNKVNDTKVFFADNFYSNPQIVLDTINKLLKNSHVADQEIYQDKAYLFMEVFENEETKKILSSVISDLDAYKKYNNQNYACDESTEIGLCALQSEYNKLHIYGDSELCLKYDLKNKIFVFARDLNPFFLINERVKSIRDGKTDVEIGTISEINILDALCESDCGDKWEETVYKVRFLNENKQFEYQEFVESDLMKHNFNQI